MAAPLTLPPKDEREPYAEVRVGPNRVALLKDGFQAYPAMLAAIASAKSTICLETYILREDATGTRFLEALVERARAGVEVLVMYDSWGSDVSDITLASLRSEGIKVLVFRPWKYVGSLSRAFAKVSRRNHRKSLIVDGVIGFTGGLNLSNDYAAVVDGGHGWRDTHVRISGPDAAALERLFLTTWLQHKGPAFEQRRFNRPRIAGCEKLKVVGNDFALDRKGIRRAYENAFRAAKERIFVTNAYFLPPAKLVKALVAAARRNVRVGVILAATTDVKLVLYAARGLYPRLLKQGIEVYEWNAGRVLHAKTAVVDGAWATIGSANLDPLSLRQNLEVNAIVTEPAFAASLEKLFLEDLQHCHRVTMEHVRGYGLLQRALSWVAYRLRHWL
ncbi:MAG: phospholipase D-like domain-containing protein [Myxococcota bacterium]